MSAPALVMLGRGSSDNSATEVTQALCRNLQSLRPALTIRAAFTHDEPPSPADAVAELVSKEVVEAVLVPMVLTSAVDVGIEARNVRTELENQFNIRIGISRPLGPASPLLNLLDTRLRQVLHSERVLELDGLVLSADSSGDVRGNALLARRTRQWSAHHKLPCLAAVADGTGPSVTQVIGQLRQQGRRHIAVGSLFLAADDHYRSQADAALTAGAVAVSAPLGSDQIIQDLVLARYAYAAMEMLDDPEDS